MNWRSTFWCLIVDITNDYNSGHAFNSDKTHFVFE